MFDHEITYEVREDGILYYLREDIRVLVKHKGESSQQVSVTLWRGTDLLPPEKGDLDSSAFRDKLVRLARTGFGVGAELLSEELGWIAIRHVSHANERYREVRQEHEQNKPEEFRGTQYSIENGGFVRELNASQMLSALISGADPFTRITNFVAEIVEETTVDDGAEARRHFRLRGVSEDRVNLPEVDVPASQFPSMAWVAEHWGVIANIAAGMGTKDQLREAIQLYSRNAPQRFIYQHTGYRLRGEKRVYLHGGGAVGTEGIEVELQDRLAHYVLPHHVNHNDVPLAVRTSLRLLDLAPDRVTVPLLALAYLAPVSEILPPDFVLWLWAATGNLKSTIAALFLSHYGDFTEDTLPLEFTATANYIERCLFLLKDIPAVVDDWRPAVSRGDAAEQDRKAQRILRAVGNRAGRGRMRSDTSLRTSYAPRGAVIVTGESIPEGPAFESATARALTVNMSREEVDIPLLSELQRAKGELSVAMHGHVQWVAEHYDALANELPEQRRKYRDRFIEKLPGGHARTPGTAASLMTGFSMLKRYAVDIKAISAEEGEDLLKRGEEAILEAAKAHTLATRGEDPATRFVEILRSLFRAGKVYVKDREHGTYPEDWAELGWEHRETQDSVDIVPERGASFVGWVDAEFLYLDKHAAYAAVASFAQRGDIAFGIKQRTLWQALRRAGLTVCAPGRLESKPRIEGSTKWVVQMHRSVLKDEGGE